MSPETTQFLPGTCAGDASLTPFDRLRAMFSAALPDSSIQQALACTDGVPSFLADG